MKKVGITVAAAVCVVLLCVGFYFMKNSDGSQASKENLTVVQRINEKNLTDDYPKTPRAVIKLYNQIITSYYSGCVSSIQLISNGSSGAIVRSAVTTRVSPLGPMIVSGSVLSAFPIVRRSPGRPLI